MSPLRVGIVGCGDVAQQVHLKLLSHLQGVEVTALSDVNPAQLAQAARRFPHARKFQDYLELYAWSGIDATIICLPSNLHARATIAAFNSRKHVYLEKPLATTVEDGVGVIRAWHEAGTVGMIGFNYRFNPLYLALKAAIERDQAGVITSVRSVFSTPARVLPEWKQDRRNGGGVLLDLASHHIDMFHFLFGDWIVEVGAHVESRSSEADAASLQMRLADGVMIQSFFSLGAVEEDRVEIYGRGGKLSVDRYSSVRVDRSGADLRRARIKRFGRRLADLAHLPYLVEKLRSPWGEPSYAQALGHFVAAARAGRPARPDLEDGLRSLAVIEAAERSAASGRFERVVPLETLRLGESPQDGTDTAAVRFRETRS